MSLTGLHLQYTTCLERNLKYELWLLVWYYMRGGEYNILLFILLMYPRLSPNQYGPALVSAIHTLPSLAAMLKIALLFGSPGCKFRTGAGSEDSVFYIEPALRKSWTSGILASKFGQISTAPPQLAAGRCNCEAAGVFVGAILLDLAVLLEDYIWQVVRAWWVIRTDRKEKGRLGLGTPCDGQQVRLTAVKVTSY